MQILHDASDGSRPILILALRRRGRAVRSGTGGRVGVLGGSLGFIRTGLGAGGGIHFKEVVPEVDRVENPTVMLDAVTLEPGHESDPVVVRVAYGTRGPLSRATPAEEVPGEAISVLVEQGLYSACGCLGDGMEGKHRDQPADLKLEEAVLNLLLLGNHAGLGRSLEGGLSVHGVSLVGRSSSGTDASRCSRHA
eukprot:scaffold135733_cov105-Phaeocystis_antarctica.AAC.1